MPPEPSYEFASEPTVLMAFQGWNDTSGGAYSAIDHIVTVLKATKIGAIDPEDYYDFQVNQPRIDWVEGKRTVIWRTTDIFAATAPSGEELLLVRGIEPSYRWKAFMRELSAVVDAYSPARMVLLGAMAGEVAHTRPFPVTATSPQVSTRATYAAREPNYVGPTGIIGVLIEELGQQDVPVLSQWVTVPQYATGGPTPKVAKSLVDALNLTFNLRLPLGDLEEASKAWERGVSELVHADSSMVEYVENLERATDIVNLPQAQGDAIAQEFERFLRRRDEDNL